MKNINFIEKFKEVFEDKSSRLLIFVPLFISLIFMDNIFIILLFNISFYGFVIFSTNEFYKTHLENRKLKDKINEFVEKKGKGEM